MGGPITVSQLVGNQLVGGFCIGDAQECFGQAHQDDALLRGQGKLLHKGIDAALGFAVAANSFHKFSGEGHDALHWFRRQDGGRGQFMDQFCFRSKEMIGNSGAAEGHVGDPCKAV